jgi:hypothetical protein
LYGRSFEVIDRDDKTLSLQPGELRVNHGHRNNDEPLAANFHSRNDYWRGVSPSNSRPLGSAGVERGLVEGTEGIVLTASIQEAIEFVNEYAPGHL